MKLKDNNKLQRNIRLLKNCTIVKMLELTARKDDFLSQKNESTRYSEKSRISRKIELTDNALEELSALNKILTKPNSIEEIQKFMSDSEHTTIFKNFNKNIQNTPATILNFKFKKRAENIAEKYDLFKGDSSHHFSNQLANTFNVDDIAFSLKHDMKNRVFRGIIKSGLAVGLSAFLTAAVVTNSPSNEPIDKDDKTSTSGDNKETDNQKDDFVPPISDAKINSYEDMYKDFFQKTAEVYKYNTGKTIDFSNFDENNIGHTATSIFTVKYNGKTYRFSSKSEHTTNFKFLEKALKSVPGAEVSISENEEITYIHDGETSIAIVDSEGNSIRSGNILTSSKGYQLYNQEYVRKGGALTNATSEEQKVGTYILSDEYNIQNEELATQGLATTRELGKFIDEHYMYKSDSTLALYERKSDAIAEEINEKAKNLYYTQKTTQNITKNKEKSTDDDFII